MCTRSVLSLTVFEEVPDGEDEAEEAEDSQDDEGD
jgi:hypothetical protein